MRRNPYIPAQKEPVQKMVCLWMQIDLLKNRTEILSSRISAWDARYIRGIVSK
jgi:hypothetical protein